MKNLLKLWRQMNDFYGDGKVPFTLKRNCIKYEDGYTKIKAYYKKGFYVISFNGGVEYIESKNVEGLEERMHSLYKGERLNKNIYNLADQFRECLENYEDNAFSLIEESTGIEQLEVYETILAEKEASVRDLHELAFTLGKKLILVDS